MNTTNTSSTPHITGYNLRSTRKRDHEKIHDETPTKRFKIDSDTAPVQQAIQKRKCDTEAQVFYNLRSQRKKPDGYCMPCPHSAVKSLEKCFKCTALMEEQDTGHYDIDELKTNLEKHFIEIIDHLTLAGVIDKNKHLNIHSKNRRLIKKIVHHMDIVPLLNAFVRATSTDAKRKVLDTFFKELQQDYDMDNYSDLDLFMDIIKNISLCCSEEEIQIITPCLFFMFISMLFDTFVTDLREIIIEKEEGVIDKEDESNTTTEEDMVWNLLLCTIAGDLLLALRYSHAPEELCCAIASKSQQAILPLATRVIYFNDAIRALDKQIPFFVINAFNLFWWENIDHTSLPLSIKDGTVLRAQLNHFLSHVVLPEHLKSTLFEQENKSLEWLHEPPSFLKKSLKATPCQPLRTEYILFGEEFEYYVTLEEKLDLTQEEEDAVLAVAMQQWKTEIKQIYPKVVFKKEIDLKSGKTSSKAVIGPFQVKILPEANNPDEHPIIEFNASPYSIHQSFCVNGKEQSVYDLIETFIIDPAKKMGCIECSGHKHMDILRSIGNNTELLFRLLVDIENKAHLTVVMQRADKSEEHFPYLCQHGHAEQHMTLLQESIKVVNECIQKKAKHKTGHPFTSINRLIDWWNTIGSETGCNVPGNVRVNSVNTAPDALAGRVNEPFSTIEFRMLHGARSKEEVYLINQLLQAWLQLLAKEQENGTPIQYTPVNPLTCSYQEATAQFKMFITQLGLDWETYKILLRPPYNLRAREPMKYSA